MLWTNIQCCWAYRAFLMPVIVNDFRDVRTATVWCSSLMDLRWRGPCQCHSCLTSMIIFLVNTQEIYCNSLFASSSLRLDTVCKQKCNQDVISTITINTWRRAPEIHPQSSCQTRPALMWTAAGTSCWRQTLSQWLVELQGGWRLVSLASMFSRGRWHQHSV